MEGPGTVQHVNNADADVEEMDDIDVQSDPTSVFYAAVEANVDLLNQALEIWGVDSPDEEGATPLLGAVHEGNHTIMQILLDRGASVNIPNVHGVTPLIAAASKGDVRAIYVLRAKGANLAHALPSGLTALSVAKKKGFLEVVAALECSDADVLKELQCGTTKVEDAPKIVVGSPLVEKITATAPLDELAPEEPAPVVAPQQVVENKKVEMRALAAQAISISERLLDLASRGRDDELAEELRRNKDLVETADSDGSTLLNAAAYCGKLSTVKLLLKYGANVNAANETEGWTALHSAASRGHAGIVKELLKAGADPAAQSKAELKPLDLAEKFQHKDVIDLLQQKVNTKDAPQASGSSNKLLPVLAVAVVAIIIAVVFKLYAQPSALVGGQTEQQRNSPVPQEDS